MMMPPPTDASLPSLSSRAADAFRSYRGGHEHAMSDLVDAVTPLLWHTARGLGLDAAAAEDVVQETWLAFYRNVSRIDEPQAVLGWLLTTTRRQAWSSGRRSRRAPVVADDAHVPVADEHAEADPEVVITRSETQGVLWRHFQELPQRCQALLRVVAMGDRPDYTNLADSLGMPVGSIGPTRGRCLAKLRLALDSDPLFSEG